MDKPPISLVLLILTLIALIPFSLFMLMKVFWLWRKQKIQWWDCLIIFLNLALFAVVIGMLIYYKRPYKTS